MLRRGEIEGMRSGIQKNLVGAVETDHGMCLAVDEERGQEWGFRWKHGEARIVLEDEEESAEYEYVFAVQVVLVSVEKV